ncbi:hypothetical protein AHF37_10125, partial [Paragonimus kellicotti]
LYSLVDWTKEVEQLVRNLQANPDDVKLSDELTAMELAARYRAMLSRFEELTGSSNEQGTLAENLNVILADLSMQGGLSATELATKRAALAAAIGSLRDLRSEVDVVLDEFVLSFVLSVAPLIAESLEYRASTVTEQRKAMVVRAAVEQAVQEDIEQLPTDLDAIRRLLAEREAMVARLAEERDASLAAMLQRGTAVKTSDLVDWIEPSENELRATWAEVDKYAEQSLIGLRQTADALEQFEGRKQRLTDLLIGTKHLIGGTASAAAAAALVMALHSEDGEMDPDAVCNALGIDESTRAWADASLASGVAGAIAASVEEATKAGQDSVRAQAEAVRAQLQAMQAAEADLVALKQAAETMKTRASAQRMAQIDETIARLEDELHKAKEDLNLRLSRLRSAEGKWEFKPPTSNHWGIGAIQPCGKGASESAALAAMAEVTGWSNTVEAELREVQAAAKRLMNLDSMFLELTSLDSINQFEGDTRHVSREVARAQAKLLGLHRRQDALLTAFQTHEESLKALTGHLNQFILLVPEFDNYISELEHLAESLNRSTIPESFDAFEKLRDEHTNRRAAHNAQWSFSPYHTDRRTEDNTAGLDLVEALNQLNTMYQEAKGPRFTALKEMAVLIEGEDVDLRTLANRGSSRPGSQQPTNDRPRLTGRLRNQHSVCFDVISSGSERGSLEGNADEVNRVLRERLRRLANRLRRLFNRLSSRWFACNAALDYEHVRQVWRQQMDAFDVRVKGLTSTADTVDLKIPRKKRDTSARTTVEVDTTQSADGLQSQDGKAASDLVEEGDVSKQQNELLSDTKEGLTPTRPSSENVDDSEALLLEEQPISSGQLYQQGYQRLKAEILDLKEVIGNWRATQSVLEFKELEDKQVDEEEKVELEPKLLDTTAVSAGLMLVTSVETNLSFGRNKDKPFSSKLQVEPFSFYVDTARFMVECDRLNGRMKANLVHVIAICESWQQLVDARDRIVEQASCLEQNACRICETMCSVADPSESGRGVSMRLARLGRQLTDWQQSLLSAQDLLTTVTTEEKQPAFPTTEPDQAAGSANEASMIINRLRELQRLGNRLTSIAPARGPTVHNLIIFAVQTIIRNANRMGELGRRTTCLSDVLQKREQWIDQVTQFLEAVGKQSGLELEKFRDQPLKNETNAVDAGKQKSDELKEEAMLDIVNTIDVATHLQVETSAEAKDRLEKILAAESRLTCKQDTMLTHLHQVCIASWEAFREFNMEINRGHPESNQNDSPMTDKIRDGLLKRWSTLHNYLTTARQQLEVRCAALSCIESGLQELESWLDPMEVLFDTCSSQLAAAACTAQSLSTLERQGLSLPIQSNDVEVAENPQTLLTNYSSEIIYFENLVASLNCRVEADLADRESLINTLKTFDWRMDRLRKVATHLLAQWTEEGERCDQLQGELRQLASAVESTAVELNASCISCTKPDPSSALLDSQSSSPSSELAFSKSLITQANREIYQFCGALAIRMRLDKLREHALRLHRRAQWLASGPSRYHNRLMQIRASKESAEDRPKNAVHSENAEENAVNQILDSESKFCGGAVLLESEAVSLEHRLAGLLARAAKAAELKRRHVNQLYLDELRVWMVWQDETQHGRELVTNHPFGLNITTMGDQCGMEAFEETLAKPTIQQLVSLLTTHLSLIENHKSRLSEGEKLVVDLKSMTFLMIRCSHLDRASPQETSGEEPASPSSDIISKESGVPVSLDELVSPSAEQLMQVMEQRILTIPIDGSEAETTKNLCLEMLEQLLVDHDAALRVISAGQTTLSDWSSELARLETHLNLALVEAKCADECETDLIEQTVKLEQEFQQLSVWKELPSTFGCEQRLNDIQVSSLYVLCSYQHVLYILMFYVRD